jgi:uncharacterized membrane protein YjgN (DUF898 family)
VFIIPYFGLNMAAQSLMLRGNYIGGGLLFLVMFVLVFYLIGVAQFRGLRYRLTRTYWRGIRGGTDEPGLKYGLSYLGKSSLGYLSLGLLLPWSMVELWNERWNKMSFGPFRFEASGKVEGLMRRFLLFYLSPFLGAIAMLAFIAPMFAFFGLPDLEHGKNLPIGIAIWAVLGVIACYFVIGLVFMAYYAKFYRQMVDGTSLSTLQFEFCARTKDWIKLMLGDVFLTIGTLGIGLIFLNYRHWKFFITHLEASGHIDVNALIQSETAEMKQGEGLLDAFDMGAL